MKVNQYDFSVIGDERGSLISLESMKNIPFNIKRVYYMYDLARNKARGFHAHKELKQVMVCLKGSCKVLLDDGKEKVEVVLKRPNQGVLIDVMIWHEMYDFSHDCTLVVLANDHYKEEDYIRNYEEFMEVLI
ncbi:sugar 3,4-ketoisomerase [Fictibacillus halophilus]|uniref:sugar 3,4-ketoisomerase n=1 Tax=Fictibacillus halophilus TaxID=1610490 RepID=UPI0036454E0A